MREVQHQCRALRPGRVADPREIDQCAVGPADALDGDDGGPCVDGPEHGGGQVAFRAGFDRDHLGAGFRRASAPGVDVGGELVGERDDGLAARQWKVRRRRGDAVAGRRNQRDVVIARADQPGEEAAGTPAPTKEARRRQKPGPRLALDRRAPRLDRGLQHRRHVGAIEIRDVAGDVEEMTLARDRMPHHA